MSLEANSKWATPRGLIVLGLTVFVASLIPAFVLQATEDYTLSGLFLLFGASAGGLLALAGVVAKVIQIGVRSARD